MDSEVKRLLPCIPIPIDKTTLEEVVETAKDWALMHGAGMRSKINYSSDVLQFAPFVLLPSVFPRKEFQKARNIQPILNELMHKVAHNYEFLSSCLKSTTEVDEFTGNLFNIYETVMKEGITQRVSLGLLRSDIMLESCCCERGAEICKSLVPYCCWKQVEVNTIASGFGWLGPISSQIQSFVLRQLDHGDKVQNLPANSALEGLCEGLVTAWKIYGKSDAVIMIVVEDISYNICDQRFHEFYIRENHPDVRVIRRRFSDLKHIVKLTENRALLVNNFEVAVVYYRTAYEPGQYGSGGECWETRLLIERSLAIKCPTIQYHLAGTKKVQQSLARPGALELFLSDTSKVESVREIFTGLYSLDFDDHGEKAVAMAIAEPERYVLKPQREGGGNNVYGMKIREVLESMKDSKERTAWILMERIAPPVQKNYLIRPGETGPLEPKDVVSELGIFGVVIGDADTIILNKQVGHMLRTKLSTADEGGVAAGLGALDSPYLVDL